MTFTQYFIKKYMIYYKISVIEFAFNLYVNFKIYSYTTELRALLLSTIVEHTKFNKKKTRCTIHNKYSK